MSIAPTAPVVEYPSEDGERMAETQLHVDAMILLTQALEDFYRGRDDVCICTDQFWYWEEGNPDLKTAPDVMVSLGTPPERGRRERSSYRQWEENGVCPAVVFEMASMSTWRNDLGDKYDLFERLGVREYFIFDPEAKYVRPALQGYRLHGTAYRRLWAAGEELESELGFRVRSEGLTLRLIDGRTNQPIPTRQEAIEAAQHRIEAARQQVDAEKQRADALAAELAELKKRLTGGNP